MAHPSNEYVRVVKETGLRSVGSRLVGSNPTARICFYRPVVRTRVFDTRNLGSIPSRSSHSTSLRFFPCRHSSVVEHPLCSREAAVGRRFNPFLRQPNFMHSKRILLQAGKHRLTTKCTLVPLPLFRSVPSPPPASSTPRTITAGRCPRSVR